MLLQYALPEVVVATSTFPRPRSDSTTHEQSNANNKLSLMTNPDTKPRDRRSMATTQSSWKDAMKLGNQTSAEEADDTTLSVTASGDEPYYLKRRSAGLHTFPTLFSSLFVIDLTDNQLKIIPSSLQDVPSLRVLRLSHNSISSLDNLCYTPQLRELSISHNCLQTIDGAPSTLEHLQVIDVRFNEISSIDSLRTLRKSTSLTRIMLTGNKVTTYPGFGHLCAFLGARLPNLDVRSMDVAHRRKMRCDTSEAPSTPMHVPMHAPMHVPIQGGDCELSDMSEAADVASPPVDHEQHSNIENDKVHDDVPIAKSVVANKRLGTAPRGSSRRVTKTSRVPHYMMNTVSRRIQQEDNARPGGKRRQQLLRKSSTSRSSRAFRMGGFRRSQVPSSYLHRSSVPTPTLLRTTTPIDHNRENTRQRAVSHPIVSRSPQAPSLRHAPVESVHIGTTTSTASASTPSLFENVLAGDVTAPEQTADKLTFFRETSHVERRDGLRAKQHSYPAMVREKSSYSARLRSVSTPTTQEVSPRRVWKARQARGAHSTRKSPAAHETHGNRLKNVRSPPAIDCSHYRRSFSSPKMSTGIDLHSSTTTSDSASTRGKRAHSFPSSAVPHSHHMHVSRQTELEQDDITEWLPRASRDAAARKKSPGKNRYTRTRFLSVSSDSDGASGVNSEVQGALKTLHEKINKLYAWHMIELDVVSRQQLQLNSMKELLSETRNSPHRRRTSSATSACGNSPHRRRTSSATSACGKVSTAATATRETETSECENSNTNVLRTQALIDRHQSDVDSCKFTEAQAIASELHHHDQSSTTETVPKLPKRKKSRATTNRKKSDTERRRRIPEEVSGDANGSVTLLSDENPRMMPEISNVGGLVTLLSDENLCMMPEEISDDAGGLATLLSDKERKVALRRFIRGQTFDSHQESVRRTSNLTKPSPTVQQDSSSHGGKSRVLHTPDRDVSSDFESSSSSNNDEAGTTTSSSSSSSSKELPKVLREFAAELREEFVTLEMVTKRLDGVLRLDSEIDPSVIIKLEQMCQQCEIFNESVVPPDVQTLLLMSDNNNNNNAIGGGALHSIVLVKDLQHRVANEKSTIGEKLARVKALSSSLNDP